MYIEENEKFENKDIISKLDELTTKNEREDRVYEKTVSYKNYKKNGLSTLLYDVIEETHYENNYHIIVDPLKEKCMKLNEAFVKVIQTGMPFVILKTAMSLDGKIATRSKDSRWISGELARKHVHKIRNFVDAIMVGTETVLKDNPRLTCRLETRSVKHPVRIILDRRNRIPLTANVFKNSRSQPVIYVTGPEISSARRKALEGKRVEILNSKCGKNGFQIKALLKELAKREMNSILIEGGSVLNASVFRAGVVDRVVAFISPILIGGSQAPGFLGGPGVLKVNDAIKLKNLEVKKIGEDLMVEATPCSVE